MSIKEMIYDGTRKRDATFMYYRAGQLWYKTENNFEFPVPIDDLGNATVNAIEPAPLLMRYIRKHLQLIDSGITEAI